MVLGKRSKFFCSFFLGKIGVEIMLSYGLEMKNGFEDDKIFNFFKSKK